MEVQWETAGSVPGNWTQHHPSAEDSFLLHRKAVEALESCTCASEHPYTLMTNYFTFTLELQFKDWIRLQTSRSGRSLINHLIHLLACSQGSQVSKNWVNLPIDSIFQCLRAWLMLLSYKDNMLLKKSLSQWGKEAIVFNRETSEISAGHPWNWAWRPPIITLIVDMPERCAWDTR